MALTKDEAWAIAEEWVAAWNAHDLDRIVGHYDDGIELLSPVAARLGIKGGKVKGKKELRAYFQRGLESFPTLFFHLKDVLYGPDSLVLYYSNQKGVYTAEFMSLSKTGKVAKVVAHYSD
jgi:hypothetical protein